MAATALDICNMALAHIGISKAITSLADPSRQEATACARFYDQTRNEVLRDFPWPFAWKYAPLVLIDGTADVATTQDFQYAYRLPADAVRVHRILGDSRTADDAERIGFSLGSDVSGGLIYTDAAPIPASTGVLAQPQLEYTGIPDALTFPADFVQVLALKLAHYIAPGLTAGDQFKLGPRAFQLYQDLLLRAQAAAAREQQLDAQPDSEFITTRL